jgi:hypothetical protein
MSTKQRKQLLWWLGLFVLSDRALIPTTCETDAGFHVQREPIAEFNYRDGVQLTEALRNAIARGNPVIKAPSSEEIKAALPDVQRCMKARTWKEVERRSVYFGIEGFEDEFVVKSWGRAPDGTWGPDKERALERHIPISQGINVLAEVILQHLSERSDLPGLPLTQSA